MSNLYKVVDIEEPDFGCEGLPEHMERMDKVTMKNAENKMQTLNVADKYLYEQSIDVGDMVNYINGSIQKVLLTEV